ncbi:MAG: hypothetical protein K2J06_08440, partial [Muribaculaceae bacterium]|nr:hypothetical protein [Muribaculaceae bacterium]
GLDESNGSGNNKSEPPEMMIPQNTSYSGPYSKLNEKGNRVVNPAARVVTNFNIQDAFNNDFGAGHVPRNIIIPQGKIRKIINAIKNRN